MNPPMSLENAQNGAQFFSFRDKRFAAKTRCASFSSSALVPSFVRAVTRKTVCYPSPSRRSVRAAGRPSIPEGEFKVLFCHRGNKSAGEDAKCAQVLKSFWWQRPQRPLLGAMHPTLSGRVLARQQAVSRRRCSMAMSQQALSSAQPAARCVTMWACATKQRADQLTQFNLITDHRGAHMPCGGLLRSVWPVMAREEGHT